ncbi:MAG: hypothetical protein HYU36_17505 [Planctomycetes bacterium]|nr:hypothetical protein [Planctomycetota bacterium]
MPNSSFKLIPIIVSALVLWMDRPTEPSTPLASSTLEEVLPTQATDSKSGREPILLAEAGTVEERPTLMDADEMPSGGPRHKWWSLDLRSAIEYDRNVRLDDGARFKGDLRNVVGLDTQIRLPKFLGTSTTLGYSLIKDFYDGLDQFNVEGHTFSGGFNRPVTSNIFLSLDYAFIWFKFDDEGYLQRHSFLPSVYWAHNESFASFLRLNWDNNDYVQVRELSGDNYAAALREFFFFGEEKQMFVWAEYAANFNSAIAKFESFLGHKATLGYTTPIPGPDWLQLNLEAEFSYANNKYKSKDARFGNGFREDNIFTGRIALSRPLYKEYLTVEVSHNYLRHRSSFAGRDYTDQISGIELQAKF